MHRAASLTLLVTFFLLAGSAQAQRGIAARGGAHQTGAGTWGGRGFGRGSFQTHPHRHQFHNASSFFVPFWYDDRSDYEDYNAPAGMIAPPAPVIVLQADKPEYVPPEAPVAAPKIIEVPGVPGAAASKPQAPAIFILSNGQHLESRRYMLTADNLQITINRKQHTIPVSMLDIDATVAANRERGLDLQVPSDPNEISLSF